jgi:hypothetical protein
MYMGDIQKEEVLSGDEVYTDTDPYRVNKFYLTSTWRV